MAQTQLVTDHLEALRVEARRQIGAGELIEMTQGEVEKLLTLLDRLFTG